MKVTLQRHDLLVLDEVLDRAAFERIVDYMRYDAQLRSVHADGYDRGWTFDDGHPLATPAVLLEVEVTPAGLHPAPPLPLSGPQRYPYPTDSPFDLVVEAVLRAYPYIEALIGTAGRAWRTLAARGFVYPPGTGLGWHDDATHYAGAYTFYAHARWERHWGGELLVRTGAAEGVGLFIDPLPNRLVVVRAGVEHRVGRVVAGGDFGRTSVSGFFDVRTLADEDSAVTPTPPPAGYDAP